MNYDRISSQHFLGSREQEFYHNKNAEEFEKIGCLNGHDMNPIGEIFKIDRASGLLWDWSGLRYQRTFIDTYTPSARR